MLFKDRGSGNYASPCSRFTHMWSRTKIISELESWRPPTVIWSPCSSIRITDLPALRTFPFLHAGKLWMAEAIIFSLCPFAPMSRANIGVSSLCTNTEWISMKFGAANHFHQQMNWSYFGRNCTRDKGAGYVRKFESTSNWCCHVANDFTDYVASAGPASPLHTCSGGGIVYGL